MVCKCCSRCTLKVASCSPGLAEKRNVCAAVQAQEEMAWQIAKMIVNDVVSQSNHGSPIRSTKVRALCASHPYVLLLLSFFNFTLNGHISID